MASPDTGQPMIPVDLPKKSSHIGPDTGQPTTTVDLPKSSQNALAFLRNICLSDFSYLLFPDDLVTTSDTGTNVGEFKVTIEPTKFQGEESFLIHANSHGTVDNVPCGTSITSYVSKKLETLQQNLHEYVKLDNLPLDRRTLIEKQNDGYVVNKVITKGADEQRVTRQFSLDSMNGFMSEGSNLLLHRLLIKKGLPEDFRLISFDSETNLCSASYRELVERVQHVGDVALSVRGIERTIESTTDLPTTWQSFFTSDGQLTNRVQVGSPVIMKVITVPTPIETAGEPPKPIFEQQPLEWENDLQMYSKFLDRKEELKSDHAHYMRRHPELRALVADFLQFVLLRKPDDVITFARNYFSAFSSHVPDDSPYMNSEHNEQTS